MNQRKDSPENSDEDIEFRDALSDVAPLKPANRTRKKAKLPSARPRMKEQDEAEVLAELDVAEPDADTDTGDEHNFRQPGVQESVMRKLRRGKFRIDKEIDLHGLTRADARKLMLEFISHARRNDYRCLRVVHGKGLGSGHRGPVLKTWLDGWLRKRQEILAFCSARPVDGGSGATYVLLRRG